MTFRTRTFLVLLGLVAMVEIATFGAVLNATRDNFIAQANRELSLGGLLFDNAVATRTEELSLGVSVLAKDFGFKSAVASRDGATIRSALINNGSRIDADVALFVGRDGNIAETSKPLADLAAGNPFSYPELRSSARGDASTRHGVIELGGTALQLVVTPVFAPDLIGWAAFGFAIDDDFALRIQKLTNLQVSFVSYSDDTPSVLATTLSDAWREDLSVAFDAAERLPVLVSSRAGDALQTRHRFKTDTASNVEVLLSMPMSDVLEAYGPLRTRLFIVLLAAFGLAIIGASLLAKTVAQPLRRLAGGAERISRGDYAAEVEVRSNDELGDLAAAFNDMQAGIRERERAIEHQATHDVLTGLPNRRAAASTIQAATAAAGAEPFAVLLLDLSGFKAINDSLGHRTGDKVLIEIARRLKNACRDCDVIARFGGHGFLAFLEGADLRLANVMAGRILEEIGESVSVDRIDVRVSLSIGIACFPLHSTDAEELQRRADIALSSAKRHNRPIAVYENGQDEQHLRRLRLVNDLRETLDRDGLTLNYQPKKDLVTGEIVAVEALVRWTHPVDGFVSPEEFIPLAEQAGLIRALTRSVMRCALEDLRRWRDDGIRIGMCINISTLDLLDEALPDVVGRLLASHGLSTGLLTLEVTESAVMQDAERAMGVMRRLRKMGIRLSVDDFGTGHSSLAQLKELPASELKVDKSFVMDLTSDEDDAAIVRTTIELGHNLGLTVTAEGVESAEIEQQLRLFGCDVIQGYHLGRPMPADELERWLRSRKQRIQADNVEPALLSGEASNDPELDDDVDIATP